MLLHHMWQSGSKVVHLLNGNMFSYRSGKQIESLYRNWEGCKEDDNSEMQVILFCKLHVTQYE